MIFRALNDMDFNEVVDNDLLCSTLYISEKYDLGPYNVQRHLNYERSFGSLKHPFYQLSFLFGHTNGALLKSGRSPYVSVTKDIKAAFRYASLEKCGYGAKDYRSIVCFEVDDDKVLSYRENLELKDFSVVTEEDYLLDLTNDLVTKLRNEGIILTFGECDGAIKAGITRGKRVEKDIRSGKYSQADSELVVFGTRYLEDKVLFSSEDIQVLIDNPDMLEDISKLSTLDELKEYKRNNFNKGVSLKKAL